MDEPNGIEKFGRRRLGEQIRVEIVVERRKNISKARQTTTKNRHCKNWRTRYVES